jgi:hypothetical protein
MQVPAIAGFKQRQPAEVMDPIRCAVVAKPSQSERHKKEMLRYFVLVIALLAVFLLIAIALYYTQGHSVTIVHVSSLAPHFVPRA